MQGLTFDEALTHCSQGASIWKFATNDGGTEPDIVLACAGDVPTIARPALHPGCCKSTCLASRCAR
ncbi:MAG: hypothetical protein ACRD4C_10265 [Candidatus Acidiferrales bacterium]